MGLSELRPTDAFIYLFIAGCFVLLTYDFVPLPIFQQTNRQTDTETQTRTVSLSPNTSSKLRLDRSSQERLTLSQAITWCLPLQTSVANWRLIVTAAGQRNLEPNTVFSKAPSIYMPRTTTPLEVEKKKKVLQCRGKNSGCGGSRGYGASKKDKKDSQESKEKSDTFSTSNTFCIKDKMEKTVFWESVQRS